jgi:lysophospholipase L1-like esterase
MGHRLGDTGLLSNNSFGIYCSAHSSYPDVSCADRLQFWNNWFDTIIHLQEMDQTIRKTIMSSYSYLALGDSYTIGEQVLPGDNFPNQTIKLLNKNADGGYSIIEPEIIATTGWTTDELDAAINAANISKTYDMVSLLIGVNNQYRGRPVTNFQIEFEDLLKRAIGFANNKPAHVFVLSIPDWGVTPFAEGRDRKAIATGIDAYNKVCETAAKKFETNYIDITAAQRADGTKEEFLAEDKLHPSGKEYEKWALQLAAQVKKYF